MPLTQSKPNSRSLATIRQERREAGEAVLQMRSLLTAEKREFTEQEQAEWTTRNAAYDKLDSEFKVAKRAARIEEQQRENDPMGRVGRGDFLPKELRHLSKKGRKQEGRKIVRNEEDHRLAVNAWFLRSYGLSITPQHKEACQRVGLNPASKQLRISLASTEHFKRLQQPYQRFHASQAGNRARELALEQRGYGTGLQSSGGALVMPSAMSQIEMAMLDFSGVLQTSEVITTSNGNEFRWPTGNDTSNKGRLLSAAATATTDTTTPFGSKSWYAYKFSSDLILVEQELLEDSFLDISSIVFGMCGERLGRIFNDYGTYGTGDATPEGIVTGSSVGKTTASSSAFTAKELIDLQHSVDPAYRAGAGFMMHDAILAEVRKLQDSQGRFYINFIDGLREGVPDRLLGHPIFINQSMDSTLATTKKVMLFGQLSKYKVRRVNDVRFYRLSERYRETDQDGFVAFVRMDGKLLNAGVNPVKRMVMV